MDSRRLNRRITVQRKGAGTDDWGTPQPDAWDDLTKAWANIRNLSGLGAIKADAEAAGVKASLRIRYREWVAAGMRAVHGSVTYSIVAVLPDAAERQYLDLVCEVVT